jgi:hypothetical protein
LLSLTRLTLAFEIVDSLEQAVKSFEAADKREH